MGFKICYVSFSYNSASGITDVCKDMIEDSAITKSMKCANNKTVISDQLWNYMMCLTNTHCRIEQNIML